MERRLRMQNNLKKIHTPWTKRHYGSIGVVYDHRCEFQFIYATSTKKIHRKMTNVEKKPIKTVSETNHTETAENDQKFRCLTTPTKVKGRKTRYSPSLHSSRRKVGTFSFSPHT